MKSLKRTLCLVLALVMVLGLFGIASATNFTDDNDVQYKEAVDVMTGVGAINGMGDGTFNPKGTITRAAAAKLVTYAVLGKATAERLTGVSSSFTDVTVDGGFAWAIPSIEYLVKAGVINGMGDGTFNPNGEISSTATLKMLLCALGYGAKGEYTGQGWDFKVTLDANKYGLTTGRTSTASVDAAATREEVALYCFNTIQKGTVKYVSTLDIYVDNEKTVTVDDKETTISETIMNTVYGGTGALTKTPGKTTDAYGRPANVWTYKGETICTAAKTPVYTNTTGLKEADFKLAVKNAGYKLADDFAGYKVNGLGLTAARGASLIAADTIGGKGVLTEVFADDSKTVTDVIMTVTNLTKVTDCEEDKAATTTVDERSLTIVSAESPKEVTVTVTAEDKVEGFDAVYAVAKVMKDAGKELPVLAVFDMSKGTPDKFKVVALSIPQSADVKVTSTKGDPVASFVADGKTYEIGAGKAASKLEAIKVGDTITVAIDKYGYVLGAEAVKSTSNVGVLIDWGTDGGAFVANANYQVKLIGLDGKEVILPISQFDPDGSSADKVTDKTDFAAKENSIVSYAPDAKSEGKFIVTVEGAHSAKDSTITTGKVAIDTGKYADDETVFIVKDKETEKYSAYTGIKNVPSLKYAGVAIDYKTDSKGADTTTAAVVYVTGAEATGSGTQNVAFIAVDKAGGVVTLKDGLKAYEAAIIDKSGVKAIYIDKDEAERAPSKDDTLGFVPVVTGYTLNSDGTMITKTVGLKPDAATGNKLGFNIDPTSETANKGAKGIDRPVKGNVTFKMHDDSKEVRSTASDCAVWVIDPDATDAASKFQLKSVANITADTNDMVFWIEDAESTVVSAIYIVKVADEEGGKTEDTSFDVTKPVFETESAKISGVTITAVTTGKVDKNGDYIFKVTAASTVDKNYTVSVTSTKGTVTYCATEDGSYASTELATTKSQESNVFVKVSGLDTNPTITVTLTEKA